MKKWFRLWKGIVRIRVTGYAPERFINLCQKNNIEIYNLKFCENGYEMDILAREVFGLKKFAKKTGTKFKIVSKKGIPFLCFKYRKHKFFLFGICLAFFSLFLLSQFLWEIEIDGNYKITDYQMMLYLKEKNIQTGVYLNAVDCEEIEEDVRNDFPDIAWVSVRTEGTRLIMDVEELLTENSSNTSGGTVGNDSNNENTNDDHVHSDKTDPSLGRDLIASQDGIILSIVTRSGTPMVRIGDSVVKGDVLVSGCNVLYDDYETVIGYEYCYADADVVIQAKDTYTDVIDISYTKWSKTDKQRHGFALRFPKRQLTIGVFQSNYEYGQEITEDYQVKLGERFVLPIIIQENTIEELKGETAIRTQEEIEELAKIHFALYAKKMDKKGFQIVDKDGKIKVSEKKVFVTADVQYTYTEQEHTLTEARNLEVEEGLEQNGIDSDTNGDSS